MNNKGFAITTILYGTLILFLMLLLSLLGILSSYKDRLSILIDKTGAARTHIMSAKFERPEHFPPPPVEEEENDYEVYCSIYTPSSKSLFISVTNKSSCNCDGDSDCDAGVQRKGENDSFVYIIFSQATSCRTSGFTLTSNLRAFGCS